MARREAARYTSGQYDSIEELAIELPVESRPKLKDIHTSVGAGFLIIVPGVAIPAIKADLA